jgi:hypothetical protein
MNTIGVLLMSKKLSKVGFEPTTCPLERNRSFLAGLQRLYE